MNPEIYKNDIRLLIEALETLEKIQDKQKIAVATFGKFTGQDIQNAVYWIIRDEDLPRFPQYKGFSRKEFNKLTLSDEIAVLNYIIDEKEKLYESVPRTLPSMLEALDKKNEAELRRSLDNLEIDKAVDDIFPETEKIQTISPEKSEEIRQVIKKDQEAFEEAVKRAVAKKNPDEAAPQVKEAVNKYVAYVAQSQEGQVLPILDQARLEKVIAKKQEIGGIETVLGVSPQIQKLADIVIALPFGIATAGKRQLLIDRAREADFEKKIVDALRQEYPAMAESEARELVGDYKDRLGNTDSDEAFPIIDGANGRITEIAITKLPVISWNEHGLGNYTEVLDIASKIAKAKGTIYILPDLHGVEEIKEIAADILTEAVGVEATQEILQLGKKSGDIGPGPISTGGIWSSPVVRLAVDAGLDKYGEKHPAEATLIKLQRYGPKGITISDLRTRVRGAMGANFNIQQFHLIEDAARKLKPGSGSWEKIWVVAAQLGRSGPGELDAEKIMAIFGGETPNPEAIGQSSTIFGTVFKIGVRQILGTPIGNAIDRTVKARIIDVAKRTAGEKIERFSKKVATSAIGKAIFAASGVLTGGLAWIAGFVALPALKAFVNKNSARVLGIMGGVLGFVIGGLAGALVGGMLGAVVGGADWKKIGKWVKWGAIVLGSYFLARMILPLIITVVLLVGGTILISAVLFIINSGAYVVPPGTGIGDLNTANQLANGLGTTIVSPYIDVQKIVDRPGPFENSDLPLTNLKYTVRVRAKKGGLTNIHFSNICKVVSAATSSTAGNSSTSETVRNQTSASCTPPLPDKEKDKVPDTLDPGQTFEFSYPMTYTAPDFEDSFVVDTFSVTADAAEKKGALAASSAVIKIGKPPEDCPQGWPVVHQNGDPQLYVIQGPRGPTSHSSVEAIDIPVTAGHSVTARHSGIVYGSYPNMDSPFGYVYGKLIVLKGSCNGKYFYSFYAHNSAVEVTAGQVVAVGQEIARSGGTPYFGNHIHYEFRNNIGDSLSAGPYPNKPPYMAPPYLPKLVPVGCDGNCNVTVP